MPGSASLCHIMCPIVGLSLKLWPGCLSQLMISLKSELMACLVLVDFCLQVGQPVMEIGKRNSRFLDLLMLDKDGTKTDLDYVFPIFTNVSKKSHTLLLCRIMKILRMHANRLVDINITR